MKLRSDEEMADLIQQSIKAVTSVLDKEDNLRLPEADNIVDMVFCFFMRNSIESIPEEKRKNYLKMRLIDISMKIAHSVEDLAGMECPSCKDGTHTKTTHFNA